MDQPILRSSFSVLSKVVGCGFDDRCRTVAPTYKYNFRRHVRLRRSIFGDLDRGRLQPAATSFVRAGRTYARTLPSLPSKERAVSLDAND